MIVETVLPRSVSACAIGLAWLAAAGLLIIPMSLLAAEMRPHASMEAPAQSQPEPPTWRNLSVPRMMPYEEGLASIYARDAARPKAMPVKQAAPDVGTADARATSSQR